VTTLYSFCSQSGCADGEDPDAALVQGANGAFYGTTPLGGASGLGIVFRIAPSGTITTLHSFSGADGGLPFSGLVQGTGGDFYGTTSQSGANGFGTVFKITSSGTDSFLRPIIAKIACSRHRSYADSKVGRLFQLRPLVPLCPFSSIALAECSSTLSAARSLTDARVPGSPITLSRTETAAPAVRYSVESFTSYECASAHRIHETGAGRFPGARNRP
jgi:uncharacterized repeat protein (TIGR03803 family)